MGPFSNYTHQNIAEFWNVATWPADRNGFGLTPADADREIKVIEKGMVLLFYRTARPFTMSGGGLVVAHAVSGVQVHGARLGQPCAFTASRTY